MKTFCSLCHSKQKTVSTDSAVGVFIMNYSTSPNGHPLCYKLPSSGLDLLAHYSVITGNAQVKRKVPVIFKMQKLFKICVARLNGASLEL